MYLFMVSCTTKPKSILLKYIIPTTMQKQITFYGKNLELKNIFFAIYAIDI